MRARLPPVGLLVAFMTCALAVPGLVAAAPVDDLVSLAKSAPYNMGCTPSASDVQCTAPATRLHPAAWTAQITPATGQEATLDTIATTGKLPRDATSRAWMIAMHQRACGGSKGEVDTFVN